MLTNDVAMMRFQVMIDSHFEFDSREIVLCFIVVDFEWKKKKVQ